MKIKDRDIKKIIESAEAIENVALMYKIEGGIAQIYSEASKQSKEREVELKKAVLKELRAITDYQNEDDFNEMMANYNAYDEEYDISIVFGVVSNVVMYDYISREGESYGQVSCYSNVINKNIQLTMDDDFHSYRTLDEVIGAIKKYEKEAIKIEKRFEKIRVIQTLNTEGNAS